MIETLKHIPEDQLLTLPYFRNRGTGFVSRAFIDDERGELERAFSDTIKDYHESSGTNMYTIVGNDDIAVTAAFTTFQWLATNVGGSVLEKALEAVGKKIVNID